MEPKPGRNDPCPCGSGKKFKRCCGLGKPSVAAPKATAARASTAALSSAEMIELVSLNQGGQYGLLERRARSLTQARPQAGLAWKALAVALKMQRKDSLPAAQKAAELLPRDAEAYVNLGVALWERGRVADAVASFQHAICINPQEIGAYHRLGNVLVELGRFEDAAACYGRVAQINPNIPEVHFGLGNLQRALGRLEQAEASFRKAIELQPNHPEMHAQLGIALRLLGRTAEAASSLTRALELEPGLTAARVALAEARADRGQFVEAESEFRRAIAVNPNQAEAWAGITRLRRMTVADADWLAAAQRVLGQPLRPRESVALNFAIGKYFDDIGDFERAFASFQRANELTLQHGRRFDRAALTQEIDRFIDTFDRRWLENSQNRGPPGERAVLVVGMPRSGTSLVEQILAAHPDVYGAGELTHWSEALRHHGEALRQAESAVPLVARLGSEYLQLLRSRSGDAQRVVDKMPGNFMFLGLIHAAMTGARIIHVRRDPVDTCFSIYRQDFRGALAYANDLSDLAHFFGEYRRIMRHWQSLLPAGVMLEVAYEDLVAEQEPWSRRLVEHAGLQWDPRCLEFHNAARSVVTMSKWQVRQQISAAAVNNSQPYAQHLGPLLALRDHEGGGP